MARSAYIYVVQDPDGELKASFTVKHELARWLATEAEPLVLVTRMRDGNWAGLAPVRLNPKTLEPAI